MSRRLQVLSVWFLFDIITVLRSECDKAAVAKVLKYVLKHMRDRQGAEKITILSRWLVMRMKKDGLNASLCQTSWATSSGCLAGGSFSSFQFSPSLNIFLNSIIYSNSQRAISQYFGS
ncbi:hypothetical protein RIF29_14062 [Crotalaria pallida]|uniref:Uncharacterized protein n=1 Tax=Crotalaria pallida TaxID=3830 RepID=A0AAN9FER9_CROPI